MWRRDAKTKYDLMIIGSINVIGLGTRSKRTTIRDLVQEHKLDFIARQEMKREDIQASLYNKMLGNQSCFWHFAPSVGNNGGLLSIWDGS